MNVIITGASGFIGRNLLQYIPKNWNVIAIFNKDKTFPDFVAKSHFYNIRILKCDLKSDHETSILQEKIREKIDVGIYLAGNTDPSRSVIDPAHDMLNNAYALVNFLSKVKIYKFIFFSSGAVYNGLKGEVSPDINLNPTLPYAISKLASEQYIKFFHKRKKNIQEYIILRFFGAYGPFEPQRKIYTKLVKRFYFEKANEITIRGDGRNLIDAMYVEDAIRGLIKIVESDEKNMVLDYCYGKPITIKDLVRKAAKIFGIEDLKIYHEGETEEYNLFFASPAKMEQLFNIKPKIPLETGLFKLAKYLEGKDL
ncbi:MAG: NAD(P)-dependent oxidoreductase [Candidatus Goldbacteria bacterium]|nr:NAD(P)-dependent oxidoreductase [Candidatus Goldiibacteriota bacterium]